MNFKNIFLNGMIIRIVIYVSINPQIVSANIIHQLNFHAFYVCKKPAINIK